MRMQSVSGLVTICWWVLAASVPVAAQDKVTAGGTALLVESQGIVDMNALREAVRNPDGTVRSVAARVAGILGRLDLAPALLDALAREQDANVGAEQVRAILYLKRLETLPEARAAATRLGGPVRLTLAEWLARNEPRTFATTTADMVRDMGESQADVFARIVAMAVQQTPTSRAEVGTAYAAAGPPGLAWRDFLDRLGADVDGPLLTAGVGAPGAAVREATVWFMVAAGSPDASAAVKTVSSALPGIPVTNDTEWAIFGRELLARRSRKGKFTEGSEIIRRNGDANLRDVRALASFSQLSPAERASVRDLLPGLAPTSGAQTKSLPRQPIVKSPLSHSMTRTFVSMTPGFMGSLMAALGCTAPADASAFGAARVLYRPDGRPRELALDSTTLTKPCAAFLRILAMLSLALPDQPVLETESQWLFISMDKDAIDCADQNPSWSRTRSDGRVIGGTIKVPRKIKNVPPVYPPSMVSQAVSGVVIAEATISATGCVTEARILRSVQLPLDLAALKSVSGWRFEPTELDGKPVPVIMTVTVNFTLQ